MDDFADTSCRLRHGLANSYQSLSTVGIFCQQPSAVTTVSLNLTNVAPWVRIAARKLASLEVHKEGWDSYGGHALTPRARDITVQVLGWLNSEELPVPAVVLGSGGTVQLEWRTRGRKLDVDLGEGEEIEFFMIDQEGHIDEGQTERDFPDRLRTLVRKFMSR